MSTRIEVNGVAYDNVEAMPADVRRVYEETLARARELSDRAGVGVPAVTHQGGVTLRTTIRKRFIVNGKEYDDESAMPTDVRRVYDEAMRAANTGGSNVKRNDLKISFQVTGPGFHIGKTTGMPGPPSPPGSILEPGSTPAGDTGPPSPIEPSSAGGLRVLLFLGAVMIAGIVVWLLARAL